MADRASLCRRTGSRRARRMGQRIAQYGVASRTFFRFRAGRLNNGGVRDGDEFLLDEDLVAKHAVRALGQTA